MSSRDRLFRCIIQLFIVARQVGRLKLGLTHPHPDFTLDLVSYRSVNKRIMSAREL